MTPARGVLLLVAAGLVAGWASSQPPAPTRRYRREHRREMRSRARRPVSGPSPKRAVFHASNWKPGSLHGPLCGDPDFEAGFDRLAAAIEDSGRALVDCPACQSLMGLDVVTRLN